MKLTTKDIITLLPFDAEFKADLLAAFDGFDADRKFSTTQILWGSYYALYTMKLQENVDLALLEAKDETSGISLDQDFYAQVKAKTSQEMENLAMDSRVSTSVEVAKAKLEAVMSGQQPTS